MDKSPEVAKSSSSRGKIGLAVSTLTLALKITAEATQDLPYVGVIAKTLLAINDIVEVRAIASGSVLHVVGTDDVTSKPGNP